MVFLLTKKAYASMLLKLQKYLVFALERLKRTRRRVIPMLLSEPARLLRFIVTGGIAGLLQLGLLDLFTRLAGWHPIPANMVAFIVAAQVNFLLSTYFTWRDRQQQERLVTLWLSFHGSILGTALVNNLVFIVARMAMPTLLASALGIAIAAILNFALLNRFVFRQS